MFWLKAAFHSSSHSKGKGRAHSPPSDAPPEWEPCAEEVRPLGVHSDAPEQDYRAAETFCRTHPPQPSRLLSSESIERIRALGCGAWGLEVPTAAEGPRFRGRIDNGGEKPRSGVVRVTSDYRCPDSCIFSTLPILAGLYDTRGKEGVYYEVKMIRVPPQPGSIAVGVACRPYPGWRMPGWNRLSAGFHTDDCSKFFEDPDGGRQYAGEFAINAGDVIGMGYRFAAGEIFWTHNGRSLGTAFTGVFMPREQYDVYAAIGITGPGEAELEVNFGAGWDFEWKEGNNWKVQGHVGMLSGGLGGADDDLPSYSAYSRDRPVLA
ncbi:hypothetical protein BD311DRAFT_248753 [Dichomitus squalens]|uniref:B30.2/SPRY domain-containing protein n=1 Tax=Dichomitus squalens TaxID=114155 RepID=A0A4Q9MQI9_9APHY|nr:hypothetical protein BD311DRAFT_248753 [Dichomitus squalens]